MKSYKYILPIALMGVSMVSCDDLFEPANEMITDVSAMYNDPQFAAGLLGNAYILLPYSSEPNSDLATDDAVSNDNTNTYRKMAAGSWSAQNDPMSQWQSRNLAIQYINLLLENVEQVSWSGTESLNEMFVDLYKGNCYGMRAIQRFYLLRGHGGMVDGQLMGVPLFDEAQSGASELNLPRNTFRECVDAILSDIDKAIAVLPVPTASRPQGYGDITNVSEIPSKYPNANMSGYNRAFGDHQRGRVNTMVLKALKAQVLLLAASPAYEKSGITWKEAAEAAAAALGDRTVVANGLTWYCNADEIKDYVKGVSLPECVWSTNPSEGNGLEESNFPPSIGGKGRVNPTQNLVDAFPMANGYPITDAKSGYNSTKPYEGRDPRLAQFIVLDGSTMGVKSDVITIGNYAENLSSLNNEVGMSTRTGYYMRKLLRNDVNMTSGSETKQLHYNARIRWTEIFLDFAEAANEAGGPTTAVAGKTAKEVIKAIRERAGICVGTTDAYLEECAASKEKMRELIRNERRLELCFENHRFYDLRRWNADLTETAKGVRMPEQEKYEYFDVDTRNFKDYMIYGPIPYSEIIKFSALSQNEGW